MHANVTAITAHDDPTRSWTVVYARPDGTGSTVRVDDDDDRDADADDQVSPLPIPYPEHTVVVAFDVYGADRETATAVITALFAKDGPCDVLAAHPAVDAWRLPEPVAPILALIDGQTP